MWGLLFAIPMAACIKTLLDECFSHISNYGGRDAQSGRSRRLLGAGRADLE